MMTAFTRLAASLLAVSWLGAAGCSFLSPQPDPSRFFTLTPLPEAMAHQRVAASEFAGVTYGLGPVQLPAYLDRNAIATRVSLTEVTYSTHDLWAEPLQTNVRRVLVENLSALLGTDRIVVYPWLTTVKVDYQVAIDIVRFEDTATGTQLTARWQIVDGHTGAPLLLRETDLVGTAGGHDAKASVAALSSAVGDLSRDIAAALRQLPAPETPLPATRKRS